MTDGLFRKAHHFVCLFRGGTTLKHADSACLRFLLCFAKVQLILLNKLLIFLGFIICRHNAKKILFYLGLIIK